ncbi:MAG: bifunctional adenosylcobinamide kinase/adenosylcobinamide-phosphate guanylyltransferase [Coriobacteriales bacterium]|nr:bifunctional adenosylcobinamide kinase/adenosylcobinamide-phosphate guanylyltransferase [Coriobacteriales bacterium]
MALVVITGGTRSGKSACASRLALRRALGGEQVVVAAFGIEDEAEMSERIARHRDERPASFRTIEATDSASWRDEVAEDEFLMVDCLGSLVTRIMVECWESLSQGAEEGEHVPPGLAAAVEARCDELAAWIASRESDTLVVTNEVGMGVVPPFASGRLFQDVLGRANRALLADADAAYLVVAGRMMDLGTLPTDVPWPGGD